jgi:3-dehydrosphinganine reductase
MTAEQHWQCMEWNFKTALCTVHEGVRRMKEGKVRGKVVLTASVMALMGFAGYSSYSPSKFAIRGELLLRPSELRVLPTDSLPRRAGLADALRNELQLYGISVHLFLPATIFSPGFENEQKLKPEICRKIEGPDEGMTPEQVAAHLIRGELVRLCLRR